MGQAERRTGAGRVGLGCIAAAVALLAAAPAAADEPGDARCRTDARGELVCDFEIRGELRLAPDILVVREALDDRLADLRASFVTEIENTVDRAPF